MDNIVVRKEIDAVLDRMIDCIQEDNVAGLMNEMHSTFRQRHTAEQIRESSLYSDSETLNEIANFKFAQFYVEGDKALLMRRGFRVVFLMKKECGKWKFIGFAKKELNLPELSKGYHIDSASIKFCPPIIQGQINSILAFHKETFKAIRLRDLKVLQESFIEYKSRRPYLFERLPVMNYYFTNAEREANRPIDCVRIQGTEATIDFVDLPLIWYLVTLRSRWHIRRVIDLSAADTKLSRIPSFYFKKDAEVLNKTC